MIKVKIIKSQKEYTSALSRFEQVFNAKAGTKEGDEADVLALLIKDYENRKFIIETPTALEAIKYRMEQQGLSKKDLARILGYKSRVSDIFSGRRKLTIDMVKKVHKKLQIPLEVLLK